MAYELPLDVTMHFTDPIIKKINMDSEDAIMAEISAQYGVKLDKEELKKALAYDRGQYEKGYADAMAAMSGTVNELNRLKSLAVHADLYENGTHMFDYHEMAGVCTIGVWNGMCKPAIEYVTIGDPLSHDEFVAWCNNYTMTYKEDGSDGDS